MEMNKPNQKMDTHKKDHAKRFLFYRDHVFLFPF
jgi:hypothetical protein